MKLYKKPELTKVEILASERLMANICDHAGSDPGIPPGVGVEPDDLIS